MVFEKQCASKVVTVDDNMTLEAFVALGGQVRASGLPAPCPCPLPPLSSRKGLCASGDLFMYAG